MVSDRRPAPAPPGHLRGSAPTGKRRRQIRAFLEELERATRPSAGGDTPPRRCSWVVGSWWPGPCSRWWSGSTGSRGWSLILHGLPSPYWGQDQVVTGLLTGSDLLDGLAGPGPGQALLLPRVMLRQGEEVFLDDITLEQLSAAAGAGPICWRGRTIWWPPASAGEGRCLSSADVIGSDVRRHHLLLAALVVVAMSVWGWPSGSTPNPQAPNPHRPDRISGGATAPAAGTCSLAGSLNSALLPDPVEAQTLPLATGYQGRAPPIRSFRLAPGGRPNFPPENTDLTAPASLALPTSPRR